MSFILVATAFVSLLSGSQGLDCGTIFTCDDTPKRILFVVDASESVGDVQFKTKMSDYLVKTVACGWRNSPANTIDAGAITFNLNIEDKIDLEPTSPTQWENDVNNLIRNVTPLKCCTPHAEAAVRAKETFMEKRDADILAGRSTPQEIAYIVSDGVPYNNMQFSGAFAVNDDPAALQWYNDRGFNIADWTQGTANNQRSQEKADYAAQKVTEHIQALLNMGIRVFFVAVPNQNGKVVPLGMFKGTDTQVCYDSPSPTRCENFNPSGPLVSSPVDEHAFEVDYNNLDDAVDFSLVNLCRAWVPPTPAPTTPPPTDAPTTPPPTTGSPTTSGCVRSKTDLMILVDTSDSMDPAHFSTDMMDVVKELARPVAEVGGRVGVATFGHESNTAIQIPLTTATNDWSQFESNVDTVVGSITPTCCTNMAEGLEMVQKYFDGSNANGANRMIVIVGDGTPFQNFGKRKWNWRKNSRKVTRCFYTTRVVPYMAKRVKAKGTTIGFVGVYNVEDRTAYMDYIFGKFKRQVSGERISCCSNTKTNKSCLKVVSNVADPTWCAPMYDESKSRRCSVYKEHRIVSGDQGSEDWGLLMTGWTPADISSLGNTWRNQFCNN